MYSNDSRAARVALGAMLISLAACVDEPTAPIPMQDLTPNFAVGDVIMVTNMSGGTDLGSLRWALSHVTGGEVIRFDPSLAGKTIILEATAETYQSVTIEGPADKGITISGGGTLKTVIGFAGSSDKTAVVRNLTITGGNALGQGAGIYAPFSTLTVENSTITGNEGGGSGAAILGYRLTLVNTTVSGNKSTASPPDDAVFAHHFTLLNSTISHNTSGGVGVAAQMGTSLVLRNSVISNNAGNNCRSQTIIREGRNISDDDSCGAPFEITIADPLLGPLADNGGPTRTHALMAGSPAINAGTSCSVGVDQRYVARDAQCDIGAFEFIDFTTVQLTAASSATFDTNGWAVLTGTVRCTRNETFDLHVELQQIQKRGRETIDVHAVATTPIACTTKLQPWTIALVTTDEPFQNGDAVASVGTLNAEKWVTPASISQSVKLLRARK